MHLKQQVMVKYIWKLQNKVWKHTIYLSNLSTTLKISTDSLEWYGFTAMFSVTSFVAVDLSLG